MAIDPDKSIERIGGARDFATKEANRFLIASVVLALIYVAKSDGIGLDEIVFGKKLSDIHVAAFVYLVGAQLAAGLAQIRYADAATFEQRLAELLKTPYGSKGGVTSIYPNQRDWFSATLSIFSNQARGWHKALFWLAAAPSLLLSFVVFTLPLICGLYYVGNPLNLRFSIKPDLDLTLVCVGTLINLIWIIQGISLVSFLENTGASDHARSL